MAGKAWAVTVVADGTPADAESALRRAQRLVAEWIRAGASDTGAAQVAETEC